MNTYYQDELRYLRDVGPEFARANPEIARTLGDVGTDPDVERLLEGVAFLCGRVRQKLDDELPELTAHVMSLLWPHYLRSIPSMSILEFLPETQGMQGSMVVAAGAEFASIPIDGTRCRYRLCWPTVLRPWSMTGLRLETAAAKPVRLVLDFRTTGKATLADLDLDTVRLHLAGEPRVAFALYLLLAAHVDHVTVSDGSDRHDRSEHQLDATCVRAAGLAEDGAVLPYPVRSFPGYRLLQEYFAFKERFLFVDLHRLNRAVADAELTDTLQVAITFNRRLESFPIVTPENVRLHCAPIINLFAHDAEPIRLAHDRVQYLVQPSRSGLADRRHGEIFSIDRVQGLTRGEAMTFREYQPFYAFTHAAEGDRRAATYYQTHVVPNVTGGDPRLGTDTYIMFVGDEGGKATPPEETVSVELTCTNRDLPTELRVGDITEPTDRTPAGTAFRNIVKPTLTTPPPLGRGLHWRLISHMSLNYVSLADVNHFKDLLKVYDFQSSHDAQLSLAHQRLLDGIVGLRSRFGERLVRGASLRGVQIELELNEDHFAGEGDAFAFASVLERFFGLYVSLNAYSQLTVRFNRSGRIHVFPPRCGEQFTPAEVR